MAKKYGGYIGKILHVDLNENNVCDLGEGEEECIRDYGINSFVPAVYEEHIISNDSTLHYFLIKTTDGVFASHIYFPEEFLDINGSLVSPTQIKIDTENL